MINLDGLLQSELKQRFSRYFVVSLLVSSAFLVSVVYSINFIEHSNIFNSLIAVLFSTIILFSIYYKKKIPVINNLLLLAVSVILFPFISGKFFYFISLVLLVYLNTRMLGFKYKDLRRLFFIFKKKGRKFIIMDVIVIFVLESILLYIKFQDTIK